jgi:transcriptional regulator
MGFHRRIINNSVTISYLEKNKLDELYSSESLIFMDEISSKVFELFKNGLNTEEIKNKIYENNNGN